MSRIPGLLVALVLGGCDAGGSGPLELLRPHHAEPDPAGCVVVGEEDRDRNGFFDFARTLDHDGRGQPFRVRETETDNGGEPPEDPTTYRIDTEFDDRGNPIFVEEGPDDDSPRTLTAYRWDYAGSGLQERAEVDRRNNGQDLVLWTYVFSEGGLLQTWEIDERAVGGELWLFSYRWSGLEVARVEREVGEPLEPLGAWRWEHDSFGRVVRKVEIRDDGSEGAEQLLERDGDGWIVEQTGSITVRGEWSAGDVSWSRECG